METQVEEFTDLEKYEEVNKCTSLKELADVIRKFSPDGLITGRIRIFNSEKMAIACENYDLSIHNTLTREFGIRQQAMMILFYNK